MFNWFQKKKPDSKDDDDSKDSANEDISDITQKDSENKSGVDETHSKSAQNEADVSESNSNIHERSKTPADDDPNPDSHLPDDSNSTVYAKPGEPASVEVKNSELISNDDQVKSESAIAASREEEIKIVKSCCQTPVTVKSVATDVGDLSILDHPFSGVEQEYTFDEAIEMAGYGKFQKFLTMLIGLSWFADAFNVMILVVIDSTIACDWNIYMWQNALMSTNLFVGMMLGGPVFGVVADNLGRRMAMAISMLFAFIFGALTAISPSIVWLLTFRTFVGFSLGSLAQGVTLCTEYYPMEHRGLGGFYINYYWSFGNIFLIVTCWIILEATHLWRILMFVASLPALGAFLSTRWYPESVRFYLVTNQYKKAVEQLKQLAYVNNARLPPGSLQKISGGDQESKGSILDLIKPPHTRSTLLFWYIWFAIAFHYYGLALMTPLIVQQGKVLLPPQDAANAIANNATTTGEFFVSKSPCHNLTTTIYFDLFWTGSAEIPGMWIFSILVQYFQRKKLLSATILINSVLILFLLVDFISTIPGKILLFVARGNSGGIFQLAMIMTSEAFPTTLRAISMGSSHAFSMLGAAIVPYAAQVLVINQPIVAVCLMSCVILLGGVAAILLPLEMKGEHIKDFSEDYEEMEKAEPSILEKIKKAV